jgi:hypothetical protein
MVPTIKDATLSKRPLLIFCDTLVNLGDLALLARAWRQDEAGDGRSMFANGRLRRP